MSDFSTHLLLTAAISATGYPLPLAFLLAFLLMICAWSRVPRRFQ